MLVFVVAQIILFLVMTLHDWVSVFPLNDLATLKKTDSVKYRVLGSCINGAFVLAPLVLTLVYQEGNRLASLSICFFYGGLTLGTLLSWWVPYFFGSSAAHKKAFDKFKGTHHFLPSIGDHVVPNTLHVILHLLVWGCFVYSLIILYS